MTIAQKKSLSTSVSSVSPAAMPKKTFVSREISFLREKAEEVKPGLFLLYSTHP